MRTIRDSKGLFLQLFAVLLATILVLSGSMVVSASEQDADIALNLGSSNMSATQEDLVAPLASTVEIPYYESGGEPVGIVKTRKI